VIYFAQAIDGGPIKIGFSRDPARRLAALSRSSRAPLWLVKQFI
jgi:hypothetical protein